MTCYKLIIAYDGTDFKGWQWQKNKVTINGTLREAFLHLFHQKSVFLVGASRTDAGVHARGQVIRLMTTLTIPPKKLLVVMNRVVGPAIVITSCTIVDRTFHPQHQVLSKTYSYRFFLTQPMPPEGRFAHYIAREFNMQTFQKALTIFIGTHDFKLFCAEDTGRPTIKTIDTITIETDKKTHSYFVMITGKSFLRYMIRRIVGAAFIIATDKKRTPEELKALLDNPHLLVKNLPAAPAQGLCLEKIEYEGDL